MTLKPTHFAPMLEAVSQAISLTRIVQDQHLVSLDKDSAYKQAETEPVTIADYGAQVILGRALSIYFPDDGVLSEESGEQFMTLVDERQRAIVLDLLASVLGIPVSLEQVILWLNQGKGAETDRMWTLDPIDGTKGFISKRHYSVGVGILEGHQPVGGLMGCPHYGEGISGNRARGAIFVVHPDLYDGIPHEFSLTGDRVRSLHVSGRDASEYRIVQSVEKAHASKGRMALLRERSGLGDALLHEMDSMEKYATIATADADLYLRLPRKGSEHDNKVWDHTPGVALVHSAGGMVTDIDGSALDFSQGGLMPNRGMIVSNNTNGGALHERIVQAVADVLAEED